MPCSSTLAFERPIPAMSLEPPPRVVPLENLPVEERRNIFCRGFARETLLKGLSTTCPRPHPRTRAPMSWAECGAELYGGDRFMRWVNYWIIVEVDGVTQPGEAHSIHELATLMTYAGEFDWLKPEYKMQTIMACLDQEPRYKKISPKLCSVRQRVVEDIYKRLK